MGWISIDDTTYIKSLNGLINYFHYWWKVLFIIKMNSWSWCHRQIYNVFETHVSSVVTVEYVMVGDSVWIDDECTKHCWIYTNVQTHVHNYSYASIIFPICEYLLKKQSVMSAHKLFTVYVSPLGMNTSICKVPRGLFRISALNRIWSIHPFSSHNSNEHTYYVLIMYNGSVDTSLNERCVSIAHSVSYQPVTYQNGGGKWWVKHTFLYHCILSAQFRLWRLTLVIQISKQQGMNMKLEYHILWCELPDRLWV